MSNPPEKTLKKRFTTEIVKPTARNIALCTDEILRSGVVAFPTETVYGLGANALDEKAVGRIFKIKGRPTDNPLIVHTHDFSLVKEFAASIPSIAKDLFAKFSPGPLTLILRKKKCVPDITTADLPSVAVRIPSHTTALTFLKACGVPLSAPSANRSGTPSPTTAQHVYDDLNGRLPFILDGGKCEIGLESTVLDIRGKTPKILRLGGLSLEDLSKAIGTVDLAPSSIGEGETPLSPGMKYKHYAPKAKVVFSSYHERMHNGITEAYDKAKTEGKNPVILCLDAHKELYGAREKILMGKDYATYAKAMFSALRDADKSGYNLIIAEGVAPHGIGTAVIARMLKASDGTVI